MIVLLVQYTVKQGAEEQAKHYVRKMEENTRKEPGCRFYAGHHSAENPRKLCFYEQYENQAALDAHRAAPHFAEFVTNGLNKLVEPGTRTQELFTPIEV